MIGKFLLVALVCVSFAQGDRVEDAINRGLRRADGINTGGVRRIEGARREVSLKSELIQTKTAQLVERSTKTQEGVRIGLRRVAETVEEKARESNAPPSVFECITRVEENANNDVESFTNKFQDDMQRLERTKLTNIETYSKPLEGMGKALEVRYERAVTQVRGCKSEICVNIAVNSFGTYVDMLFAQITRVMSQVTTATKNFQRDSTTFLSNANRQITRVKTSANRNIRLCLLSREAIFEEFSD